MILVDCEQGSDEWHASRAGCITASMFSEVRKRLKSGVNKGDYTGAAKDYAFRVAIERISGEPLTTQFQTPAMLRGVNMEEDARQAHEAEINQLVTTTGFCKSDDGKFGASADGLIGEDGGSEYKCLVDPAKIRTVLIEKQLDEFTDQIQGAMWLTERKWWHFCLYCPMLKSIGKELYIHKVKRDPIYIAKMVRELEAFDLLVSEWEQKLRE